MGGGKRKSADTICEDINTKYNCIVSSRTVLHYVNMKNMAGASPLKCGPDGGISAKDFKVLVTAYETYVRIKQVNAEVHGNNHTLLSKQVNNTKCNGSKLTCLLKRLQKASTIHFQAGVANPRKNKGSFGRLTPTYPVGTITGNYSLSYLGLELLKMAKSMSWTNKGKES